jgi:hypothetical protein
VEYRSVAELKSAIEAVESGLRRFESAMGRGRPITRQIRVTTDKGF